MTDEQLAKWGERYGLTLAQVNALAFAVRGRAKAATKECNGDPHPRTVAFGQDGDKNLNAEAWGEVVKRRDDEIVYLARKYGFDGVDFGVGLYPVLSKGNDTCIMVPVD